MGALRQAELAFVGGYGRQQIKERLNTALRLYGHAATEENYSRAASALVTLRQENGTSEMAILDHMIRSHVEEVSLSFPEAAALSSVFLAAGDK
jgi:23S rRNA maturation-related 3'-5' exoribonuclease YhaM